ncbi:phosphatidylserine decarboxylase family protein [Neolewinella aurantiaca]|uniref:Phosphatidylserine decarboxylase proenzyme n=1 Tax=Neolewinella aurantiaca TaxID=2602767 RepID=A0A5C7G0Y0_9BACT|nr:phosphatidylserine decarboxylase family protein [Neolewinella aurantiaca]TXF91409.1 phosphatidylserine decarboxylase family protein [Neolewinella aurantiaca]
MNTPLRIHAEGRKMLVITFVLLAVITAVAYWKIPAWGFPVAIIAVIFFLIILQFFRNPPRLVPEVDDNIIYAPADGKVVVIEEAMEPEYFKDKRLQVSIFMSPVNVHVNRNPVGGEVKYNAYHPGKYLVAWHPKSSTENERTTMVINNGKTEILLRQIAGALAKRIKNYATVGDTVKQGEDFGFIKFGSRVDLFLPLGTKLEVELNQKVKGNKTVIGRLS